MANRLEWENNHQTEGTRVYVNDLGIGSSGDDVKKLQKKLASLGYSVGSSGIDGKFGEKTLEALKHYQSDNGQDATGVIDVASIATMGLSSANSQMSKLGLGITANAAIVPVDSKIPTPVRYGIYIAGFAAILYIGYKLKTKGTK